MKKFLVATLLIPFLALSAARSQVETTAEAGEAEHTALQPDAIQWHPAPLSLPRGAQVALLCGNPFKAGGSYVIRVKVPDTYKLPVHWHSSDVNVTIIQGSLLLGVGDQIDDSKMKEFAPGSFLCMPKTIHHHAIAKGTTIVQVHGAGPFDIHYADPADDPRKIGKKEVLTQGR